MGAVVVPRHFFLEMNNSAGLHELFREVGIGAARFEPRR